MIVASRARGAGFTLIELMIALTLSLISILAAVSLFAHSSVMFRASLTQRSLQDAALGAMTAIRRDVELAGFFAFADPRLLESVAVAPPLSVLGDCGTHWSDAPVQAAGGSNNGYAWSCPPYVRSAAPGADTLLVRHVEAQPAHELETGRIYLESAADGTGKFVVGGTESSVANDPLVALNAFSVDGYYVSTASVGSSTADRAPSLRVKRLSRRNGVPRIIDEEVQPGIEDLQVEFGIDTMTEGQTRFGAVERYVTANELEPDHRVLTVRVWLLARSLHRHNAYTDTAIPAYADRPSRTMADGYQRRLFATTIATHDAL